MKTRLYQEELLLNPAKKKIIFWPRRSGRSTTIAKKAVKEALNRPDITILVIGMNKELVRCAFHQIREECPYLAVTQDITYPRPLICFGNGSKIKGFSASSTTLRGQDADIILIDNLDGMDPDRFDYSLFRRAEEIEVYACSGGGDEAPGNIFHSLGAELVKRVLKDPDYKLFLLDGQIVDQLSVLRVKE